MNSSPPTIGQQSQSAAAAMRPIGWGIIGTGNIAHSFAQDFAHVADGRLVAVASRNPGRADAFGEQYGIPHRYHSDDSLAADPQVEAVYVATPASIHKANAEVCLRAGKAVLCEKPFTVTGDEAEQLIKLAAERNTFLMEAMWTRFLPIMSRLRSLLEQDVIGAPQYLTAGLGSQVVVDPQSRVYNRALGGGALLQKGVYALSLASMIMGPPTAVRSLSTQAATGVDEQTAVLLEFAEGRLATLWCSVAARGYRSCTIVGTKGEIVIHEPVICPSVLTVRRYGDRRKHAALTAGPDRRSTRQRIITRAKDIRWLRKLRERLPAVADRLLYGIQRSSICDPPIGEGLHYQVAEVNACLRAGRRESELMPLSESLRIVRLMDQIRRQNDQGPAA